MQVKAVQFLFVIFVIVSISSCKTNIVSIDDSDRRVKKHEIDSNKLSEAYKLINTYKEQLKDSTKQNHTVLKGVTLEELLVDVEMMLAHPNSTIIGETGYYCSVAAVINWLINNQPEKYTKAVLELGYYGKTRVSEKSSKIRVPNNLRKRVDYKIIDTVKIGLLRKDIDSTSISDFILGVSLTHSEKFIQKAGLLTPNATHNKGFGNFLYSNTAPWEINDYFKKMGVSIEEQGYYLGDKETVEELFKIQKAVEEGKMPIIFDNHLISHTRYKNLLYKFTGAHFLTIHSFEVDTVKDVVNYTFWDYGKVKNNRWLKRNIRPMRTGNMRKDIKLNKRFKKKGLHVQKNTISIKEFLKAMKGYWIPVGE